jgi:hypothetical protein
MSHAAFDQHSACAPNPDYPASFEFFGSEMWNPNPLHLGWGPWTTAVSPQQQQQQHQQQHPLSVFGASAVNTLADSLIEPATVLGSGDVLLPADALKQLMAASVSRKAGVALSVQRLGSSLLVNSLASQEGVRFDSVDALSPVNFSNRTTLSCCLRCRLPMAICSCAAPRKSIGNGGFRFRQLSILCIINSNVIVHVSKSPINATVAGPLDDVFDDLQAALLEAESSDLPASPALDFSNAPLAGDNISPSEAGDQCSLLQLPSSTAVAAVGTKPKNSRRVRRSNREDVTADVVHVDASRSQTSFAPVSTSAVIDTSHSTNHVAVATCEPETQLLDSEEHADDSSCSSCVVHREFFSHVRRVNLENLSLVIGSNLPIFQVVSPPSIQPLFSSISTLKCRCRVAALSQFESSTAVTARSARSDFWTRGWMLSSLRYLSW